MVHYFESPLDERQYGTRRNKRTDSNHDDDDDEPDPDLPQSDSSDNDTEPDNLPPNFPHAPLPNDEYNKHRYPLGVKRRNLARQHLNALNAILHKSLFEHDFPRASSAFGLILRTQVSGQRVDLRKKGLWGIGAEILLRQPGEEDIIEEQQAAPSSRRSFDNHNAAEATNGAGRSEALDPNWPTDEGFNAARSYYERLILQYPHRRTRPNAISAQHFYPAMFGLWIFHVQTRSQRATASLYADASASLSAIGSDISTDHVPFGARPMDGVQPSQTRQLHDIKISELMQAEAIAARLAEVTFLPPSDRDAELLKLRGMVELWLADLVTAVRPVAGGKEIEKHRVEARTLLRRARVCGWKVTEDLSGLVGSDGDEDDVDDDEGAMELD